MNTTGYCYPNDGPLPTENVNCSESNACVVNYFGGQGTCSEGFNCFRTSVERCSEPTVGTCQCVKRCASRLLEIQTRRLGKGLGIKRDWSVEVEEEDTPH